MIKVAITIKQVPEGVMLHLTTDDQGTHIEEQCLAMLKERIGDTVQSFTSRPVV